MTNVEEIVPEKLGALNKGKENSDNKYIYRPPATAHWLLYRVHVVHRIHVGHSFADLK